MKRDTFVKNVLSLIVIVMTGCFLVATSKAPDENTQEAGSETQQEIVPVDDIEQPE